MQIVKAIITHYNVKPNHIFRLLAKSRIPCKGMPCMEMLPYLAYSWWLINVFFSVRVCVVYVCVHGDAHICTEVYMSV